MRHPARTTAHTSLNNTLAVFVFSFVLVSCLGSRTPAQAEGDWALTLYGARLNNYTLDKTLIFKARYTDSYVGVLALSWRAFSFRPYFDIEVEGQVGKHFGGGQDNWEVNAVPVARWRYFPWNDYLRTSVAVGAAGVSWALGTPVLEGSGVPHPSRVLSYEMFEVAVSLPQWPNWAVVARLHHRSAMGGLIGNNQCASNAIGFGIKYVFP